MSSSDLISLSTFAERYGICKATVHNMIRRGELEALKVGRLTKITKAQEQLWYKSLKRVGGNRGARDQ